ncbi:MAG: hypothetical protein ACI9S8_000461 [Chlamydiales bacterium]|jgi:hypothetical protein
MSRKQSKQFYSEIEQIADSQAFLDSIHEGFSGVEDPRVPDNQHYPLISLLVMILCAILAGANTIIDIYTYSKVKHEMFRRLLKIERSPSYDVY